MHKTIILLIFLAMSNLTFSQYSYFKEAEVTKNDLTKLKGFVKKTSESSLNPKIKFKTKIEDQESEDIPVAEIKEVYFHTDSTLFQKVKYNYRKDSVKITEYRLAKKLAHGYAQLFKLQLPENERNIIFENNNTFLYIALVNEKYYVLDLRERMQGNKYRLNKNYQKVLFYILQDHPELQAKAYSINFNDNSITSIINHLNSRYPEVENYLLYKKEKLKFTHNIGLGTTSVLRDKKILGTGLNFGYGINIYKPSVSEKLSSEISISYNTLELEGNRKYSYFRVPIGFRYNLTNTKVAPFVSGGIAFEFINQFNANYFMYASAGITISKRIYVTGTMDFPLSPALSRNNLYFNIGYLFGKK